LQGCIGAKVGPGDWKFADHMNRFVASDRAPSSPEGAKRLTRADRTVDSPMILFQHIVEILHRSMPTVQISPCLALGTALVLFSVVRSEQRFRSVDCRSVFFNQFTSARSSFDGSLSIAASISVTVLTPVKFRQASSRNTYGRSLLYWKRFTVAVKNC
jgi:hypothetical protein